MQSKLENTSIVASIDGYGCSHGEHVHTLNHDNVWSLIVWTNMIETKVKDWQNHEKM